ncbi:MAG: hypothetical protein HKN28_06030 [Alphaproteobacteria bacterium]|nr:hypothetical protein [Alphaproteobacteria bacterium]
MKGRLTALAMAGAFAASVFATAAIAGNGGPNGPHYNLNIIGVENPKKADMTGSNRHTIFVALHSKVVGKSKTQVDDDGNLASTAIVDSKIWLTPGPEFRVCDGNGFDAAYDGCDSDFTEVNGKDGAVFMLPCNTNIGTDDDPDIVLTECDLADQDNIASYSVWVRGLGKPGGSATVTTCATAEGDLYCSLENAVVTRSKGKSEFTDVTNELTSLRVNFCDGEIIDNGDGTGICDGTTSRERIALFSGDTEDWFWNYDNKGLRLAQLRFYAE